jgi:hypothetical protein
MQLRHRLPVQFRVGPNIWVLRGRPDMADPARSLWRHQFYQRPRVVLISHWQGNVMEKNREFGFLIDDRATSAERNALEKIFTGHAGGAFAAWRDLTISLDGVEFVPMTVTHDPETWRVQVPGLVDGLGGPYRKYMVPPNDTCRIYNAPRPEVVPGFLTVGEAKCNVVTGAFGRKWDWSMRSSKHIAFDLRGPKTFSWRQPLKGQ